MPRAESTRVRRLAAAAVVTVIAGALAGVLPIAPTTAPAAGPSVSATPSTGLLDGQFVNVTWSGFPAGSPTLQQGVAVSQCSEHPVNPARDCALSELGITGTDGGGLLPIPVHTGAVQSRNGATTFTCDEHQPCSVAVYSDPNKPLQSGQPASVLPITFGFPASACPHGGTAGINGSGGEAVYRAILRWEAVVCQAPRNLDLQYTRTESTEGKDALVDPDGLPPDFAVTSVPLDTTERAALTKAGRKVITAPVAASGLVFTFHGTDRVSGQRITHVTLTPSQLARIFNGSRDSLPVAKTGNPEDDDIVDLNPGVNFKGSLQAFGRLDAAAGSLELTSWFLAVAPDAWKATPAWVPGRPSADGTGSETKDYETPTQRMPDGLQGPGASGQLINGPDNLGLLLAGKGSLGDPPDLNMMGYLDSSTARFYGLPTVCLQLDPNWRTTHTPCVDATPENITKGLAAATRNEDGTVTAEPSPADPSAYPLVDVSYLVADQAQQSAARAATLKSLIAYGVGDGQQAAVLPPGYAPLPADLAKASTTAAATITGEDPAPPPAQDPSTGGGFTGTGFTGSGGFLGGGSSALPTAATGRAAPHKGREAQAVASVRYSKAGKQLSGRASWWVVIALTLLCLAGLLAHPTVRSALRLPTAGGPKAGRSPPEAVAS